MSFTRIGQTEQTQPVASLNEVGSNAGNHMFDVPDQVTSEIATWLGKQAVPDMDKAAVLRASSHGVDLEVKFEGRFPQGQNGERLPSYQVAVGCNIHGDDEARKAALADLRNFMATPLKRQIEDWLAELSVIVAKRRDGEFDEALRLEAYSSRLAQYPADVVKYVVLEHRWQFWPTWAEMQKICEAKTGPRKHMIFALSQTAPPPTKETRPPTVAERERIQNLINEQFPSISKEWRDKAAEKSLKGNCMTDDAA